MIKALKNFGSSKSLIVFAGIALALLLRFSLREFQSGDFLVFTERWYQIVKGHGFGVFRHGFYDYTPAYLYALFLASRALPWISAVFATKVPSIVADFVCAWYAYRIIRLHCGASLRPLLAALAVLFAPTVVI